MSPLVAQGIELMLLGMGTVFAFLSLLVFATTLMSRTVHRFWPQAVSELALPADSPTPEEVAAISVAMAAHLQKQSPR